MSKLVFASVISEIQQSDVFMTVKARICEAPAANLNGARVTEAFIDEIVSNEKRYVGLPLYADVKALTNGNYNRLGHLYDVRTGEFHSTQVGSFYKFEKQVNSENCYLVGYARIPKRNKKLSKAISELFADGALKFSFELSVGEYEELDDDTILIDASENNYLEGTAIVTYPACEDAVALELVAQKADDTRKGDEKMAEVENKAEVVETEATQPELAEEEKVEAIAETEEACKDKRNAEEAENAETEAACKDKQNSEEEAACKDKKQAEEENAEVTAEDETAAVIMHEHHCETTSQCAFDTETGKEICQTVSVETHTSEEIEGTLVETVDGVHVAEKQQDNDPAQAPETVDSEVETVETPAETPVETPAETPAETSNSDNPSEPAPEVVAEKKTAEEIVAEMLDMINDLKAEIAELKEQKQVAEVKTVTAEVNPFMDTLVTENKYSLLEKDEKVSSYSLLSK